MLATLILEDGKTATIHIHSYEFKRESIDITDHRDMPWRRFVSAGPTRFIIEGEIIGEPVSRYYYPIERDSRFTLAKLLRMPPEVRIKLGEHVCGSCGHVVCKCSFEEDYYDFEG